MFSVAAPDPAESSVVPLMVVTGPAMLAPLAGNVVDEVGKVLSNKNVLPLVWTVASVMPVVVPLPALSDATAKTV